MKRIFTILVALLALTLFAANAQNKKQTSNTAEVTFVTSIECKNCVKKVEANLPYEKGIKDMKIDLPTKTVWIKYDPGKTNEEKLAAAIKKLGYDAKAKK